MHTNEALLAMALAIALPAWAAEPKAAGKQQGKSQASQSSEVKIETEDQKTIYALGVSMGQSFQQQFNASPEELELLKLGVTDGALKRTPKVDINQYRSKFQQLAQARGAQIAAAEKKASEEFLKKMAAEPGAVKSDSGLIYIEEKAGTGESPTGKDRVKVHYHGTLRDGTVFDSSVERGTPATFALGQVIPCWTEGLQKMKVGGKAKLVCPSNIAYGDRGQPPRILPGSTLVFDVELLEVIKTPTPAGTPAPQPGMPQGHP